MSDDTPSIPSNFGFRYIAWWVWCHMILLLSLSQTALASVMLLEDPDASKPMIPHNIFRWLVFGNAIACAILAKIERKMPPQVSAPDSAALPSNVTPLSKPPEIAAK